MVAVVGLLGQQTWCGIVGCGECELVFFFFKQKTSYEMRISDWSSDVCSSDLSTAPQVPGVAAIGATEPTTQGGANIAVIADASDAARARVLGTAELAGIEVYGLDGTRTGVAPAGEATGIDTRAGFMLGGQAITLAVVAETTNNSQIGRAHV